MASMTTELDAWCEKREQEAQPLGRSWNIEEAVMTKLWTEILFEQWVVAYSPSSTEWYFNTYADERSANKLVRKLRASGHVVAGPEKIVWDLSNIPSIRKLLK